MCMREEEIFMSERERELCVCVCSRGSLVIDHNLLGELRILLTIGENFFFLLYFYTSLLSTPKTAFVRQCMAPCIHPSRPSRLLLSVLPPAPHLHGTLPSPDPHNTICAEFCPRIIQSSSNPVSEHPQTSSPHRPTH